MGGGITQLPVNDMMVPRGQYGLGSLVKSVKKTVKKGVDAVTDFAKSDIGKAALMAAVSFGVPGTQFGGLFGRASFGGPAMGLFGQQGIGATLSAAGSSLFGPKGAGKFLYSPVQGSGKGIMGKIAGSIGKGTLASAGLGFLGGALAGGGLSPAQIEAGMARNPAATKRYLAQYYKNLNQDASDEEINEYVESQTREYLANGGFMMENSMGGISPAESSKSMTSIEDLNTGGITQVPTGKLRKNQQGVKELDYRDTGGFVPVGIKEKADDVPAMLSKNEFVFTADAVRGAGNGNVNKGAQRLYDTMKTLENGGTV